MHDAGRPFRLGDVGDEAAVDLDLVEREALQIAQRGVAGAEIVERDPDPDGAKLVQNGERRLVVANEHGLGDFKLEPAGGEARRRQRRHDFQRQGAALELNRRDVDREPDIVRPGRGFRASGGQYPLAERVDQAGFLGNRNKLDGRNHAALRMAPAQQRLAAGDPVVLQVETRLIIDLEAAIDDRLAQIHFENAARADLGVHFRFEKTIGAAAGGLGRIHCEIRILQDLVEIGTVLRRQRDADAGVGGDLVAEAFIGRTDRLEDAAEQIHDVVRVPHPGLNDGELVAAKPGDEIGFLHAAAETERHRFEQLVADHVSERVVDALEFVDVDIEHRQLPVVRDVRQFFLEPFVKQSAVRQVGQRVVMGEVGDALLGAAALGNVFMGRHPSAVRQRFVDDLDRAAVRRRNDHRVPLDDVAHDQRDIAVDVADE